jgi:predicted PurR-regulated permease PerM
MNFSLRNILVGLGILVGLILLWYLRSIVAYLLIAAVVSLIGRPLVLRLNKVKIGRFKMPHSASAIVTLLIMILVMAGFVSLFVPLIAEEARIASSTDPEHLKESLSGPLIDLETWLDQFQLAHDPEESNAQYLEEKLVGLVNITRLSHIFQGLIGTLGNVFIALFSILFITFFFLKDPNLLYNIIFTLTPEKHRDTVKKIMRNTKTILRRYCIGLIIQITLVTLMVWAGLSIIGVENALAIGFFAGLVNVIPYIGPIIGAAFGIVIGLSANLELDFYAEMLPLAGKIASVFFIMQLIDNFLFQPFIFSQSVNVHPLEIFLVIMIAGTLAGIPAMILAVPTYSLVRIIAHETLSGFKIIRTMTKNMDDDSH